MCLIFMVWYVYFDYVLVVVVNWDEFYDCFVVLLVWWSDVFNVLVGCDMVQVVGYVGMWMGMMCDGCFVVLMNYCVFFECWFDVCLCGEFVLNFLMVDDMLVFVYFDSFIVCDCVYNGYNLLIVICDEFWWISNCVEVLCKFVFGLYGLFNVLFDMLWFKVWYCMVVFVEVLVVDMGWYGNVLDVVCYFDLLLEMCEVLIVFLFVMGVVLEWEKLFFVVFICLLCYGMCVSIIVCICYDGCFDVIECCFDVQGQIGEMCYFGVFDIVMYVDM